MVPKDVNIKNIKTEKHKKFKKQKIKTKDLGYYLDFQNNQKKHRKCFSRDKENFVYSISKLREERNKEKENKHHTSYEKYLDRAITSKTYAYPEDKRKTFDVSTVRPVYKEKNKHYVSKIRTINYNDSVPSKDLIEREQPELKEIKVRDNKAGSLKLVYILEARSKINSLGRTSPIVIVDEKLNKNSHSRTLKQLSHSHKPSMTFGKNASQPKTEELEIPDQINNESSLQNENHLEKSENSNSSSKKSNYNNTTNTKGLIQEIEDLDEEILVFLLTQTL